MLIQKWNEHTGEYQDYTVPDHWKLPLISDSIVHKTVKLHITIQWYLINMIVQRAEKHIIQKSNPYYPMIDEFCFQAKNLYNHANYPVVVNACLIQTRVEQ